MNTRPRQKTLLDIQYRLREMLPDTLSDPCTLAIIDFGDQSQISNDKQIIVGTPALAGSDLLEVWRTDELPENGKLGDIHYRRTSTLIFGRIMVDNGNDSIESITQNIYQQISRLQQELNYPQMIRMWNYLPWINRHDDGMERYQSFCVGRHQAIDTSRGFESHLSAATAVGTHDNNVLVYFIAAREDGIQIENPLQVSAFDYPARYAPKSPAFSRAMVKQWGKSKHLYISGTASILGHETRHKNKLLEQLDECLNNMDVLVAEAHVQTGLGISDTSQLTAIKIYLIDAGNLEAVLSHVRKRLGNEVEVLILSADICREDLLLEIEGVYSGKK
ncbi:MAG TPA: hypothetical protein ENI67_01820 [Gammaproteobacteria bacterium]|nr:hypothetical protein [Gammaproteobacteria bacterium]